MQQPLLHRQVLHAELAGARWKPARGVPSSVHGIVQGTQAAQACQLRKRGQVVQQLPQEAQEEGGGWSGCCQHRAQGCV